MIELNSDRRRKQCLQTEHKSCGAIESAEFSGEQHCNTTLIKSDSKKYLVNSISNKPRGGEPIEEWRFQIHIRL
jgi:hypothetical protein